MNGVMNADVWSFFCKQLPRNQDEEQVRNIGFSEIEWLSQTEELKSKLIRSTVSKCDENEVIVKIPLMTRIFELQIRKSDRFPEEKPEFGGEFIDGFHFLEWKAESTLFELSEKITDQCNYVDRAILEIKECESDGFHILELGMDDEETGHLLLVLKTIKYNEQLTLSVDIEDFLSFPRVLRCSNSSRTTHFDCEKWIRDDRLGLNLRRLYGKLDVPANSYAQPNGNSSPRNDSFENVEDIMDFI